MPPKKKTKVRLGEDFRHFQASSCVEGREIRGRGREGSGGGGRRRG